MKNLMLIVIINSIAALSICAQDSSKLSILFAGEQWTVMKFEIKGFDYFGVGDYDEGGQHVYDALADNGHKVTWIKSVDIPRQFPESFAELKQYDVIILSDIGSNSLLFHPDVLRNSIPHPNRLSLLKEYVENGGGLAMIGGWMSFAGIGNNAKYHETYIEDVLPVNIFPYDDRDECPEGVTPQLVVKDHAILKGMPTKWPFFLGYNKVVPKEGATTILKFNKYPLITVWDYERGRTAVFTSDCAPHWGPVKFLEWEGYSKLWNNLAEWLANKQ
jgi:uncharacterized membrane protein